jgi:hypothetical protein
MAHMHADTKRESSIIKQPQKPFFIIAENKLSSENSPKPKS